MKKYDYGIFLFKIFMSYCIVATHFGNGVTWPLLIKIFLNLAVPCYMFISFYYVAYSLMTRDIQNFYKRIKRLFIPYFGWGIIIFISKIVIYRKAPIKELFWQFATGSSAYLDPPLWFLADMIAITVILFFIFIYIKSNTRANIVIGLLCICCLVLQYNEVTYKWFWNLRYEMKWTLGRLFEMFPYSVMGIYVFQIMKRIRNKINISGLALLMLIMSVFIWKYPILKDIRGFDYQWIYRLLLATSISIIFIVIPIPSNKYVMYLGQLTSGIYYIHFFVGSLISNACNSSLYVVNITFFLSLIICIVLEKCGLKKLVV